MRHANEGLTQTGLGGFADHFVEDRHERVEALYREPGLAGERAMDETLERFDVGQPIEQRHRIDRIRRRVEPAGLDRLSQPAPLFRNEDVGDVVPVVPQ